MTSRLEIKGSYRGHLSDFYVVDSSTILDGHINLGCALAIDGKLRVAIDEYKRALELNHFSSDINQYLGQAYLGLHEKEAAITFFKRSLRIREKAEINYLMGILLLPSEEATHYFRRALQQETNSDCKLLFAKSLYYHRNFDDEDGQLLESILEEFPGSVFVLSSLARVQRSEKNYDLAEINYRQAILVDIKNIKNYIELAEMLAEIGRFNDAMDIYKKANMIRPSEYFILKIEEMRRKDKEKIKKRLRII